MLIKSGVGGAQQHRLDASCRLDGVGSLRNLLAHRLAILALERIVAIAIGTDLAPGVDNRLGGSRRGLGGIARKEECGAHTLLLEHLQDLLGGTARPFIKRQGDDLLVALGRHAGARNDAIGGGHNLAAVLRLARLLTNPHLGAALDTPRLHILDSARTLDLELGLDNRSLNLVLLVGVTAILDRHLLAALKFAAIPFALLHALAVDLHRQLFAPMALEHAVIDGKQVACVVGVSQLLVVDEILQRRAHTHRGLLAVELHVHTAVDVAHDGSDKQHERATHGDERVGQSRRTTGRTAVADARTAIAKPAAMVEIHRAGLTVTLALTAG